MTAIPQFIAKRSIRKICCEVFGRALLAWAACVPVAIWLGLDDQLRMAALVACLGGVAAGVALGASLIERRIGE